jgi:hypothetical protein
MNMPRLGTSNVANAVPQRLLAHQKVVTAQQALDLGASAITIYLFLGYNDRIETTGLEVCSRFASECRQVGLPCIMEPLAYGGRVTGANMVEILTLGRAWRSSQRTPQDPTPATWTPSATWLTWPASRCLSGDSLDNERDALVCSPKAGLAPVAA